MRKSDDNIQFIVKPTKQEFKMLGVILALTLLSIALWLINVAFVTLTVFNIIVIWLSIMDGIIDRLIVTDTMLIQKCPLRFNKRLKISDVAFYSIEDYRLILYDRELHTVRILNTHLNIDKLHELKRNKAWKSMDSID